DRQARQGERSLGAAHCGADHACVGLCHLDLGALNGSARRVGDGSVNLCCVDGLRQHLCRHERYKGKPYQDRAEMPNSHDSPSSLRTWLATGNLAVRAAQSDGSISLGRHHNKVIPIARPMQNPVRVMAVRELTPCTNVSSILKILSFRLIKLNNGLH